ncbi:MAG: Hsp33 family molecular chaperone HslO [Spirochaetaceae bacterium]
MIAQPIRDASLREHLEGIAQDGMDIFLLGDGEVRGAVVHATRMVNQMRRNHELGILETLILGHAYIAAALLTAQVKGNDKIRLLINCDGPAEGLSVESRATGQVRGYLHRVPIPVEAPPESFDLAPFLGNGTLSVTKELEVAKHPFTGEISLEEGSIARDLARYFLYSEQTATAFNLSVKFDTEGRAIGAGGVFLQALPGANEETLSTVEETLRGLPSLGEAFAEGSTGMTLVKREFNTFDPELIGTRDSEFYCGCSKERFGRFIGKISMEELESIREEGPFPLKTTCHNCGSTYSFSRQEIETIYRERIQAEA